MSNTALYIKGLKVRYGAIEALKGIDMEVKEGDVVAILGANGAGKTTTLRTISGLIEPAEGSILFYNHEIGGKEPEKIAALGLSQSPEGRQVSGRIYLPGYGIRIQARRDHQQKGRRDKGRQVLCPGRRQGWCRYFHPETDGMGS